MPDTGLTDGPWLRPPEGTGRTRIVLQDAQLESRFGLAYYDQIAEGAGVSALSGPVGHEFAGIVAQKSGSR